jgi:heptose-I-phosphate ethanolaminephosphotransferase
MPVILLRTKKCCSSSDFIYTWADLAGIDFTGFDASRSLINQLFTKHPIWIGNPDKPKTCNKSH